MLERSTQNNKINQNTKFMLAGLFGMKPCVPLQDVVEEFLDVSFNTAQRKARLNELPFPAFQMGTSQKAPWYVSMDDLTEYIVNKTAEARKAWKRAQV